MENVRWIAAAALSAYACHLAVHHTTPIDQALPFLAVTVTLLAWLSYPAVMLGVPLLIAAEIAIAGEQARLLAFGVIVAASWAAASIAGSVSGAPAVDEPSDARPTPNPAAAAILAVLAILVLRWIPLQNVLVARELFLIVLALAIVFVLGSTPFAVAVAVLTTLATPAVPLRTLALPLLVLAVAAGARLFGLPAFRLAWLSTMATAFVLLFFAWSGIVARALPWFFEVARAPAGRVLVNNALGPDRSMTYEVPDGTTHLVVSGANVAHLRRGALLGRMEAGVTRGAGTDCAAPDCIPIRIGDAADWGYLRRDQWYRSHNPLPGDPAGVVRDYGYAAWVDGAGRVRLPEGARAIRITADGALPVDASLQVEGFE